MKLVENAVEKAFSNTNNDTNAKEPEYYDNLIVDCAFQRPLIMMSHDPNLVYNCDEFYPILTINGLCHSFNGAGPENIYSDSKIMQSFNSLFRSIDKQSKKFRGTGHSEGKFF